MFKYVVYLTTNLINQKIYIGVHKTININDSYLGSGIAIKKAIKKYGRNNFRKNILYIFENKKDAYLMESFIVNQDFIKEKTNYNLQIGGLSSSDRSTSTIEKMRKPKSEKGRANIRKALAKRRGLPAWNKGLPGLKGIKNGNAKHIQIFNSDDVLMFDCQGNFKKTCEENNLPFKAFFDSYHNNGRFVFNSDRPCDIKRYTKDGRIKYKGWYAKLIT